VSDANPESLTAMLVEKGFDRQLIAARLRTFALQGAAQ
jgi:hypothetical protein